MSTLSDVTPQSGTSMPSCTGLTPDVLPEVVRANAENSNTGVSIEYAPTAAMRWYVLRITYGREKKAYDYVTSNGIQAYLPQHHVYKIKDGRRVKSLRPLIPNLLFVHCSREALDEVVKGSKKQPYIRYYYNHLVKTPDGKDEVMTVRDDDMQNFIRVTSVNNPHIKVLAPETPYKAGDYIEVIDGPFTGVRGHVARYASEQRVVITVNDLFKVATAYIPTAFLRVIPPEVK